MLFRLCSRFSSRVKFKNLQLLAYMLLGTIILRTSDQAALKILEHESIIFVKTDHL